MTLVALNLHSTPNLLDFLSDIWDLSGAGPRGDKLAINSTVLVVTLISQLIYGCLGIFGAARHGLATSGNVLSNEWLPLRSQVEALQSCPPDCKPASHS